MKKLTQKTCLGCNNLKPRSSFKNQHSNPDGLNKHCNDCLDSGIRHKKPRKKRTYQQNRNDQLKKKFGITTKDFDDILDSQNGACAICGEKNPDPVRGAGTSGFVVDHCHDTGVLRAILCGSCNKAIGFMNDDPTTAEMAAKYLTRWMRARNEP